MSSVAPDSMDTDDKILTWLPGNELELLSYQAILVDYVITSYENFDYISEMYIHDITEFSDHCPVAFSLQYSPCNNSGAVGHDVHPNVEKLNWDYSDLNSFDNLLESKRHVFDSITDKLLSGECNIDQSTNALSDVIHDVSFTSFGYPRFNSKVKKSLWFDEDCRKGANNW